MTQAGLKVTSLCFTSLTNSFPPPPPFASVIPQERASAVRADEGRGAGQVRGVQEGAERQAAEGAQSVREAPVGRQSHPRQEGAGGDPGDSERKPTSLTERKERARCANRNACPPCPRLPRQALRQQLSALQEELRGKESRWASTHSRLRQQIDSLRQENTSLRDEVHAQTLSCPRTLTPQRPALLGLGINIPEPPKLTFLSIEGPNVGEAPPPLLEETCAGERSDRNEGEPTST